MLDEKDLQAIAQLMLSMEDRIDQKMASMESRIVEETTNRMNVLLETKIQKDLRLLQENQQIIMDKLDQKISRDEFEDRVSPLEGAVKKHTHDIAELKKAQ